MFLCVYANYHRERQPRSAIVSHSSRPGTQCQIKRCHDSHFDSKHRKSYSVVALAQTFGLALPAVREFVYHIADTNPMVRDILSTLQSTRRPCSSKSCRRRVGKLCRTIVMLAHALHTLVCTQFVKHAFRVLLTAPKMLVSANRRMLTT